MHKMLFFSEFRPYFAGNRVFLGILLELQNLMLSLYSPVLYLLNVVTVHKICKFFAYNPGISDFDFLGVLGLAARISSRFFCVSFPCLT
jgi:hypothetical protein